MEKRNIIKKLIYPLYNFICFYLTNYVISYIPIRLIRIGWYKLLGMKGGLHSYIDLGAYILCPWKLSIGNGSHINRKVFLDARGGIKIGNSVSISHNVSLISASHNINSRQFDFCSEMVEIEDYVFIGANVTILKGCKIGYGAVVCAGSVVTKDVEPYTVVGGIPARKIAERTRDFDYECNPQNFFF